MVNSSLDVSRKEASRIDLVLHSLELQTTSNPHRRDLIREAIFDVLTHDLLIPRS